MNSAVKPFGNPAEHFGRHSGFGEFIDSVTLIVDSQTSTVQSRTFKKDLET